MFCRDLVLPSRHLLVFVLLASRQLVLRSGYLFLLPPSRCRAGFRLQLPSLVGKDEGFLFFLQSATIAASWLLFARLIHRNDLFLESQQLSVEVAAERIAVCTLLLTKLDYVIKQQSHRPNGPAAIDVDPEFRLARMSPE
jgi:hypothetical protein